MSGGITGCRRGMLRVRDWLAYFGLVIPSDQFGQKKKRSDRAESALLSSLRNIANQNNLRKDTIKRANLQNWKFAFAFTA